MTSKEVFTLKNITKTYGNDYALKDFSITINKGELVAIIGPSGAGKTTLMSMLATIINQDSGSMHINGKLSNSFKNRKELAKEIGIIRQQFDLVTQLPVIHNVLAGRLNQWGLFKSLISLIIPQDKKVATKALERVGIESKTYEKTANLSGGEQQRVALARLLVQKPKVILADEPVSSLDPARSEDIMNLLTKLVIEEDQTLIASLHSVEYARKYFTRIVALRNGEIYFDKPSKEVNQSDLDLLYDLKELT